MTRNQKQSGRGHVTETPDVSHIKNVDVTHEESDVAVKGVATFVVGLTVLIALTYVIVLVDFKILYSREEKREPAAAPMALSEQERLPAEPRLQSAPGFGEQLDQETSGAGKSAAESEATVRANPSPTPKDPLWEIKALQTEWNSVLSTPGKDKDGNPILSIQEAKQQLIKQGLPARSRTIPEEGPGWQAQDYGVDMPTAASSGRMTEKRRQ